jgi:hypothetical protein
MRGPSRGQTFVTPTLLAGDRSLVNVVAHEIAHSWSGNLVTNASWGDFWLNEGWTVFLERKILGRLRGEAAWHAAAARGWGELAAEVGRLGAQHRFTRLVHDLSDGAVRRGDVAAAAASALTWHARCVLSCLVPTAPGARRPRRAGPG